MTTRVTSYNAREFAAHVSGQSHAMAGAVIVLSAAHAVSLGLACLQIDQEKRDRKEINRMEAILAELLDWSDRDAGAISLLAQEREAGRELVGQQLLCNAPVQVARLAVEAAQVLENFRPSVSERVGDDMEMSLRLLIGAAQAALLLLDSNLRIWPEQRLLAQFEPQLAQLNIEINNLSPVTRIRE